MEERPRVSKHNVNNLYNKVLHDRPKPTDLSFEDDRGVPIDYASTLRGKYWKDARAKIPYLSGQNGMLQDKFEDIIIDNDLEFALAIESSVDDYSSVISRTTTETYRDGTDFVSLITRMKTPKSHFWVKGLYETLESYITRVNKREEFPLDKEAVKFYFKHLKLYDRGIAALLKLDEEEQTAALLTGIITGTSSGFDLWTHQAKNKFPSQFAKFTDNISGREFSFTVHGILDAVDWCLKNNYYPPFTLFYRTQGGTSKKVRAVFGGNMLAKAVGALLHAAKNAIGKEVLPHGDLPWIAWENWDTLFHKINDLVSLYYDRDDAFNVIGEDFTGWDQTLHQKDFTFLFEYAGTISPILDWSHGLLQYSDVWSGAYKIRGVHFKSGHPLTSELGSFQHLNLNMLSAKANDFRIDHAIFLSDDNLIFTKNFDLQAHTDFLNAYGFETSPSKASDLRKDHYVEFLKVHIGKIFSTEGSQFAGNPLSRLPGFRHMERLAEVREVYNISDGKDVAVDQVVSKLSSFGYYATEWVQTIVHSVRDTPLGKRVINALIALKHREDPIEAYRPDLLLGFTPEWLKELDISLVRKV